MLLLTFLQKREEVEKNRKNSIRSSAKNNISGTTSMTNNGIQNAKTLSKCDKHNYRKYDNC